LTDYIRQHSSKLEFLSGNSWVILNPIEKKIKEKIEEVGAPLKDWDISINYGIKTGCNEAFIIDKVKRDELIKKDKKSAEIIRSILRGRDIKRYGYEFADLYLLFIPWHFPKHLDTTITGASKEAERVFKEEYPAVYNHLLQFRDMLSARNTAETGIRYEWYALQRWGANYWDDFSKQKIVWKRVGSNLRFCYDNSKHMVLDSTCFATGKHLKYLLAVLNSKIGYYLLQNSPKTGTGDLLISVQAIEPLRIPKISYSDECKVINLVDILLSLKSIPNVVEIENEIDHIVYKFYDFTKEEIMYIKSIFP
jgi:hypothetical protein